MRALWLSTLLVLAAAPAAADAKRLLASGAWEAYVYSDASGKVCYAAARADRTQGGDRDRTGSAMAVTHRPKSPGEVSVIAEYGLRKDGAVEIQIGGMQHAFFAKGNSAWAKEPKADAAIVGAMVKGREVIVRAQPAKGAAIVDSVPLAGFSAALAAIDKECGVKR